MVRSGRTTQEVDGAEGGGRLLGEDLQSVLGVNGDRPGRGYSVDLLVGALLGDIGRLAAHIREAIRGEIAAYRSIPDAVLDLEVGRQLAVVLRVVACGDEALTDETRSDLAAVGERRARQGVPVDELLRAWRVGLNIVVAAAHEIGQRLNIDDTEVLAFVQSALVWSDRVLVLITRAHRGAARAVADEQQARFVRKILSGGLSCADVTIEAEMHGLDPGRDYVAIRARRGQNGGHRELQQVLGLGESTQCRRGLCAELDGHAAGFVSTAPPRDIDAVVGFGPPRALSRLAESYRFAVRALATAEACGLRGAYDMASLGLRPAIALDADVGELLRSRYLEPLARSNSSSELIETLRTYLACGMHVERTATRLFVHQNTVRYRIARFEELIGASLANIEVLFELWWALEVSVMDL